MKNIVLEILICAVAAAVLMVFHEFIKVLVYMCCKQKSFKGKGSPWKLWRYIDPIGMVLAVVCYVPISKPYFFRIRDQKTNCILGIAGLLSMITVFVGSILFLHWHYGGMEGLDNIVIYHWYESIMPLFIQYLALLSFGIFVANLFPISTFDMGLLIAGISAGRYLYIIKVDGIVKMILILTLLLDVIHYIGVRLLQLVL